MSKDSAEETKIRTLIESWARAVRERDIDGVLAHHAKDIVMFDVPPPFKSVGIDEYKKTWDTFYSWADDLKVFDILEMEVVAGDDVAFCYASMRCAGYDDNGKEEELKFRLTVGLKKVGKEWVIKHEHHSVPGIS